MIINAVDAQKRAVDGAEMGCCVSGGREDDGKMF